MKQIAKQFIFTILAFLLFFPPSFAQKNYEEKKVEMDKNFRIGKLPNGLTYYIKESKQQEGYADFFIAHNVGSLQEEENQRGLAHFLEHMAFNGTKHFPGKELLDYLGRIGVMFGTNVNAFTSFDRTVYNISAVPVGLRSSITDTLLLALHDWSSFITCEQEEIDKERGVVREEWRRGDNARTRMAKGTNQLVQRGSRFAERDVIGLMSVVDNFSRQTLIDYYHKWYRPDLQAIIVVGDVDADDIEMRIKERFSSLPKVQNGAVRESYSIPDNKRPIVGFLTDPETKAISVKMIVKIPNLTPQQRESQLSIYEEVSSNLFLELLKERIASALKDPNCEVRAMVPIFGESSYAATTFTITSLPKESHNTFGALKEMTTLVEGVRQHGFSHLELERAKPTVIKAFEKKESGLSTLKNKDYAMAAAEHYCRSIPLYDYENYYKLAKEITNEIDVEQLNSSIERYLSETNRVIVFSVPESDKEFLPSEEQVYTSLEEIANSNLEPFELEEIKEFELPEIDKKAKISNFRAVSSDTYSLKFSEKLDSTYEWTFDNGAKVIWKEQYGNNNSVQMKAFKKGGYSIDREPQELKILEEFFNSLTVNGMSRAQVNRFTSINKISLRPSMDYRNSIYSGKFDVEYGEKFFGLLYHYFTAVTVDQEDLDGRRERIVKNLRQGESQYNSFRNAMFRIRFSHNPMRVNYENSFIENLTTQMVEQLYSQVMGNIAEYTFIFSGPMSAEKAKELTSHYIGTIPTTQQTTQQPILYRDREPIRTLGELTLHYKAKGMHSTAASVERNYHGPVEYTAKNNMIAKLITYILRDRYLHSIREEKGGTYYVAVAHSLNKYPTPTLSYSIEFDTNPELVEELLEEVQKDIDNLITYGPTERELTDIVLYLEKVYANLTDRVSWPILISDAINGNENVELREPEFLNKITKEEIQQLAKEIFTSGNRMTFIFEPTN